MARITAAKRRLAEENRMEWAEIGTSGRLCRAISSRRKA